MATYEIYRNTGDQTINLTLPSASATYTATISSDAFEDEALAITVGDKVEATIPFKFTQYDGPLEITLKMNLEGSDFEIKHSVEVVTPILLLADLSDADRDAIRNPSAEDFKQLERFIRHIIEAYTGQSFGYSYSTYTSADSRNLSFNVPLLEFVGVSDRYATHSTTIPGGVAYELIDEGFAISVDWNRYHIKTDSFIPIRPSNKHCHLSVTGKFGYLSVPEDVRQAALVLLGLFMCDQSLWRDRYIENLRNADGSTIKYNEGAYIGTGSVTADQLLLKYVRTGIISADVV